MRNPTLLALVVALALSARLEAQCPDGTPPPCAGGGRVAAPRAAPVIDDNTWIVLPFDNLTRAADLDWLPEASVSLLYLDLSRWSDVRAIDDRRVSDLLRQVPRRAGPLSLDDGLLLARRAGAGRLVMGQFLKLGNQTTINATAYNVKTGARFRETRQQTAMLDSLPALFGRVARGLLAVAPPAGARVGEVGTNRADALQEYLAGTRALNEFDIPVAKQHLQKALALDPAFALAHYKLAIASAYDEAGKNADFAKKSLADVAGNRLGGFEDSTRAREAAAAQRLSSGLPKREQGLIAALLAQSRKDYGRACMTYASVVAGDSSDVEALYGLGTCLHTDDAVETIPGDPSAVRFRSDWNPGIRALQRALAVDPTFHLAFDPLLKMVNAAVRLGCRPRDPAKPCEGVNAIRYSGRLGQVGDSVVFELSEIKTAVGPEVFTGAEARRTALTRVRLERARRLAQDWVDAGPREGIARVALAEVQLRLGLLDEAERNLAEAARLLPPDPNSDLPLYRVGLALRRGQGSEAVRLLDSMQRGLVGIPREAIGLMLPITGRFVSSDSAFKQMFTARGTQVPPVIMQAFQQSARVMVGVGAEGEMAVEKDLLQVLHSETKCGGPCLLLLGPAYMFGLQVPRTTWPVLDTIPPDPRLDPARALSRGDTAALRVSAQKLDSISRLIARTGATEDGASLIAAEAYLMVRDSAAALTSLRRMLDTTMMVTPEQDLIVVGGTMGFAMMLWPRATLLRAELAAARQQPAEAREWYRRFAELWAKADPEYQPTVERAKKGAKN